MDIENNEDYFWYYDDEEGLLVCSDPLDHEEVIYAYAVLTRPEDVNYKVMKITPVNDTLRYDKVHEGTIDECDKFFAKLCKTYLD